MSIVSCLCLGFRGMLEQVDSEASADPLDVAAQRHLPHLRLFAPVRSLVLPERRHLLHRQDRREHALQLRVSSDQRLLCVVWAGRGGCPSPGTRGVNRGPRCGPTYPSKRLLLAIFQLLKAPLLLPSLRNEARHRPRTNLGTHARVEWKE